MITYMIEFQKLKFTSILIWEFASGYTITFVNLMSTDHSCFLEWEVMMHEVSNKKTKYVSPQKGQTPPKTHHFRARIMDRVLMKAGFPASSKWK